MWRREVEPLEKDAQVDSTGSAEGQGSMRGPGGHADGPQHHQTPRQPSPDHASPLQQPPAFPYPAGLVQQLTGQQMQQ